MTIAGQLVIFLVVLAGLMVGFTWLSHLWLGLIVGRKHMALEDIYQLRLPPPYWTEKHDRKLQALALARADAATIATWQRRKQQRIVTELQRLIVYVTRTSLVPQEEVRREILDDLTALQLEWGSSR